ncbi:MAG: hypothetical protein MJ105_09085 [Lachnospiraceae bacterium]|nr:hypothetical protein [Lachnospiraceae bacterium]
MTYKQIVANVEKAAKKANGNAIASHFAMQLDVKGKGEGALYVEFVDGKINVQPYEYYDHNAKVIVDGDALCKALAGTTDIEKVEIAYEKDGETAKKAIYLLAGKEVKAAAKKAPAKKEAPKAAPAAKKEEVKKAPAKKAPVKKEAPKAAAPAKKAEAPKKEEAKKVAAPAKKEAPKAAPAAKKAPAKKATK